MDNDTFLNRVDTQKYPFEADSYHELFKFTEEFYALFNEAKRGGIHFVNIFRDGMKYRIGAMISKAIRKALDHQTEHMLALYERGFATGDEEFDNFRRLCLGHDWYYDYTDDGAVWRRGNEVQKKLEKIVAEKGGKYKEYWENYALKKLR